MRHIVLYTGLDLGGGGGVCPFGTNLEHSILEQPTQKFLISRHLWFSMPLIADFNCVLGAGLQITGAINKYASKERSAELFIPDNWASTNIIVSTMIENH